MTTTQSARTRESDLAVNDAGIGDATGRTGAARKELVTPRGAGHTA